MTIIKFTVLITFDLNYADSSDYRAVDKYLSERDFERLSQKGDKLPSNIYLGKEEEYVGKVGRLLYVSEADAAKSIKDRTYRNIKNMMKRSDLTSVVFVMVSPEESTFHSCSRLSEF